MTRGEEVSRDKGKTFSNHFDPRESRFLVSGCQVSSFDSSRRRDTRQPTLHRRKYDSYRRTCAKTRIPRRSKISVGELVRVDSRRHFGPCGLRLSLECLSIRSLEWHPNFSPCRVNRRWKTSRGKIRPREPTSRSCSGADASCRWQKSEGPLRTQPLYCRFRTDTTDTNQI